jgi:hypothetical protein
MLALFKPLVGGKNYRIILSDPVGQEFIANPPDRVLENTAVNLIDLDKPYFLDRIYTQIQDIFFDPFTHGIENAGLIFYFYFPEH